MTPEEFKSWRSQPETKEFFTYLWRVRLLAMEDWAHQAFVGTTPDQSNRKNDNALGQVEAITKIFTIKHADIESFYEATGGVSEFQYPIGREDHDQQGAGLDAPRPA
jgi:hypothetical protein